MFGKKLMDYLSKEDNNQEEVELTEETTPVDEAVKIDNSTTPEEGSGESAEQDEEVEDLLAEEEISNNEDASDTSDEDNAEPEDLLADDDSNTDNTESEETSNDESSDENSEEELDTEFEEGEDSSDEEDEEKPEATDEQKEEAAEALESILDSFTKSLVSGGMSESGARLAMMSTESVLDLIGMKGQRVVPSLESFSDSPSRRMLATQSTINNLEYTIAVLRNR